MPNSIVTQRFIKCHDKLKELGKVRSSRQFAVSLEYLPQSLSEIIKGRRDVTIELLRKAIEKYRINPGYVFIGEGTMFLSDDDQNNFRVLTVVADQDEDERIVHVPVPAQAGYSSEINDPTFIQELPTFTLPDYKYKSGTHRSFDVSGESMETTLFEGDKVICSYLEPNLWMSSIKNHYLYVIVTRGDILVKRVLNKIEHEKCLELISDNPFFDPYKVDIGDVREMWYVRAKITPFLPSPQNLKHYMRDEIQKLNVTVVKQADTIEKLSVAVNNLLDKIKV